MPNIINHCTSWDGIFAIIDTSKLFLVKFKYKYHLSKTNLEIPLLAAVLRYAMLHCFSVEFCLVYVRRRMAVVLYWLKTPVGKCNGGKSESMSATKACCPFCNVVMSDYTLPDCKSAIQNTYYSLITYCKVYYQT